MADNVDESAALKNVPVIAPVGKQTSNRQWVAKKSGQQVNLMSPNEPTDVLERQEIREAIERGGQLVTTPQTFAELMADYLGHHESKARDRYGMETSRETRGRLDYPRVWITALLFTGKETVLQEELESGLIPQEEVEAYRVLIRSEHDPVTELVVQVLRLLSKTESKGLVNSRRLIDRIHTDDNPDIGKKLARVGLVEKIADYLLDNYSDEVGDTVGEETLRTFVRHRNRILEQWKEIKPGLSKVPTKELMNIVSCSNGTAKNIKYGRTEPSIEIIKKIIATFPNGYNPVGV